MGNIQWRNSQVRPMISQKSDQAVYYSKMRYNMESDMSVMVMKHHQQLTELELMKKWKKEA